MPLLHRTCMASGTVTWKSTGGGGGSWGSEFDRTMFWYVGWNVVGLCRTAGGVEETCAVEIGETMTGVGGTGFCDCS